MNEQLYVGQKNAAMRGYLAQKIFNVGFASGLAANGCIATDAKGHARQIWHA